MVLEYQTMWRLKQVRQLAPEWYPSGETPWGVLVRTFGKQGAYPRWSSSEG